MRWAAKTCVAFVPQQRGDAAGEKAFTGHKIETVCMELMDRAL